MFLLISIIIFFLVIFAPLFVLLLWVQVQDLKRKVETLAEQVAALLPQGKKKAGKALETFKAKPALVKVQTISQEPDFLEVREQEEKPSRKTEKEPIWKKNKIQIDYQKVMANLPVWIGGVALVLAGLFMVQYSIEKGLLSPGIRLIIGGFFGFVLLLGGHWVHAKPGIANNARISQALSGAGIAVLYICLYAGTSFYTLLPPLMGFIGMAGVTCLAVVLSLRQGPPIAVLGLIGGVLTPGVIESKEPQAQFLFFYLYLVLAGLFVVIRQKNWWYLSIPTVFLSFAWVMLWIATSFSSYDGLWLGLFLLASSVTVVMASTKAMEQGKIERNHSYALNALSLGGALLLMTVIAMRSNFGEIEWGLFACLTAGGLILAYYNPKLYSFVPWLSLVFNLLMLCAWTGAEPTTFWTILIFFAVLFTLGSYWLLWSSHLPVAWGLLTGISSFAYYALAYAKDHKWFEGNFSASPDYHFWSFIAFFLFAVCVGCLVQLLNRFDREKELKQKLLSIFTLMATGFFTIGLLQELSQEFFRVALVAEAFVLAWLNTYTKIKILRPLSGAFTLGFLFLLVPQLTTYLFFLSGGMEVAGFEEGRAFQQSFAQLVMTLQWSLVQLGLPAGLSLGASFLLRKERDDFFVQSFEMLSVLLIAVMTYSLLRLGFHPQETFIPTASFVERAIITNAFYILGLAFIRGGNFFNRQAIFLGGLGVAGLALFRTFFFDILIDNPLSVHEYVGYLPLMNGLLLAYGFPCLWVFLGSNELEKNQRLTHGILFLPFTNTALFILVFVFISLNIRQLYQGAYLDGQTTTDIEIYTYSVVWILLGLAFLFFGTLKQNKTLRIASFAFICLSVGKVFLYDAAELEGLYRVFSFLGLGLSLLGLSWFYTRFVFQLSVKDQKRKQKRIK